VVVAVVFALPIALTHRVTPALMLCCNPVECWAGGFTKLLPNMSQDAQQALLMMWEEMKWFYCSYMTEDDPVKPDPGEQPAASEGVHSVAQAAVAVAGTAILGNASERRGDKSLRPSGTGQPVHMGWPP